LGKRLLTSFPKLNCLNNNSGQFAIEAVLIMTVLVSAFVFGTSQLRESKALARLISSPWVNVVGMIECGEWKPVKQACQDHPGQRERAVSFDPRR